MMKQYDDIIIGFGKGGKTLAAELARRGHKVAMIERSDKMYGGTCINIGCIPTKPWFMQPNWLRMAFRGRTKRTTMPKPSGKRRMLSPYYAKRITIT